MIGALLSAALLLAADGWSVEAPREPVPLGRRFQVVVRGPLLEGDRLEVPAPPEGLLAEAPQLVDVEGGRELRWPLRAVREGDFVLGGLGVRSGDALHALPELRVGVTLELAGGGPPAVAGPLAPVRVPYAPAPLAWVAGAAAAVLLLLGWIVLRAGRVIVVPPPPQRPPELIAAEALARLRGRLPRSHEEVPAFVVEVSHVLRAYIEGRYGVHAPESTTEEFLPAAAAHPALAGHRDVLRGFLTGCDLVKFARHRPEPSSMAGVLATAEGFVEATRT